MIKNEKIGTTTDMSGFQLVDLIVTELKKLHVEIQFLSLVEITAFRVESKSC